MVQIFKVIVQMDARWIGLQFQHGKVKNNKFNHTFVYKVLFTNPSFAEICSKVFQLA